MATKPKSKESLLETISKLLALANGPGATEGERQNALDRAEILMGKYNIELWELAQVTPRADKRTPVTVDFDFTFAFESGPFPEICDSLWSMFCAVASHANCVIVFHKQHYSGVDKTYRSNVVPIIGTEMDLGYMELLFSTLMTQLIDATHPKVDKSLVYEENLRKFREAGWGWLEVAAVMQEAGYDLGMTVSDARHKEAHAYRRYCKRVGIEQNYANFKTYRRNFAYGFAGRVNARLAEMRTATVASVGTGLEIALRDQRTINLDFMREMFPDTGGRRGGSMVKDNRKFDSAAHSGGRAAGDRANIIVNPGKGLKDRKSLGK